MMDTRLFLLILCISVAAATPFNVPSESDLITDSPNDTFCAIFATQVIDIQRNGDDVPYKLQSLAEGQFNVKFDEAVAKIKRAFENIRESDAITNDGKIRVWRILKAGEHLFRDLTQALSHSFVGSNKKGYLEGNHRILKICEARLKSIDMLADKISNDMEVFSKDLSMIELKPRCNRVLKRFFYESQISDLHYTPYVAAYTSYAKELFAGLSIEAKKKKDPNARQLVTLSAHFFDEYIRRDGIIMIETFGDELVVIAPNTEPDTILDSDLGRRMQRYCSVTLANIDKIFNSTLNSLIGSE